MTNNNAFDIQNSLYEFPYHYIPHFEADGTLSLMRRLNWGFDYLCYQKHIQEKVVAMKPRSILEVGCGDGYFIGMLPHNEIEIRVGVDPSEKAIAFAKAFHPHCSFFAKDIDDIEGKFDIVAAIEVIEHIPKNLINSFFLSLSNKLNDHGKVVLSVPTVVSPINKKHYRHYTLDLLQKQITDSNSPLQIDNVEYIYSNPWWMKIFKKFFNNQVFSLEIKAFMRFAWNQIWNKYRFSNRDNGHHLVVTISGKKEF